MRPGNRSCWKEPITISHGPTPSQPYGEDLAYIHDAGHGEFAARSLPGILETLRAAQITSGRVVDLGCGSGITAAGLTAAGYEVLGIDISEALIVIARERAPRSKFRVQSLLTAELPPCEAVTAVGEVFSYMFDPANTEEGMPALFGRIYAALRPGGVLLFDVVAPGRVGSRGPQRSWRTGEDWATLVEAVEDDRTRVLTRRIVSFRKMGELYRRGFELHRQRLFDREELTRQLQSVGFRVLPLDGYGELRFGRGHIGFVAHR
jgi:SAM-dependent methyltransferase